MRRTTRFQQHVTDAVRDYTGWPSSLDLKIEIVVDPIVERTYAIRAIDTARDEHIDFLLKLEVGETPCADLLEEATFATWPPQVRI